MESENLNFKSVLYLWLYCSSDLDLGRKQTKFCFLFKRRKQDHCQDCQDGKVTIGNSLTTAYCSSYHSPLADNLLVVWHCGFGGDSSSLSDSYWDTMFCIGKRLAPSIDSKAFQRTAFREKGEEKMIAENQKCKQQLADLDEVDQKVILGLRVSDSMASNL